MLDRQLDLGTSAAKYTNGFVVIDGGEEGVVNFKQ